MSGSSHHQSSGDSSWRPGKQGLHRGPPYWRSRKGNLVKTPKAASWEKWLRSRKLLNTCIFWQPTEQHAHIFFREVTYINHIILFSASTPFCWLPKSMTTLNTINIGIVLCMTTVLRCNQVAVDKNHWLKILDSINVISAHQKLKSKIRNEEGLPKPRAFVNEIL